jgi:2Fe-2S ferredoxin
MKCKITFAKAALTPFFVDPNSNLMKSLLQQGVPVASSCGGEGICGKCRLLVIEGAEHLSEKNDVEKFLCESMSLKPQERVSCQTQVLGDVKVDAGYW